MNNVQVNHQINAEEEYQQIRNNMLTRLYTALNNLKGKCVLADTLNSFNTWEYYNQFDWNLIETKSDNPKMKIELKNDFDSEEYETTKPFTFCLDEIMEIDIDDNLEYIENTKSYYCESIIITLWNESKLRLELQW